MYLESIFGSPDIVRQLPAAAKLFQAVDKSWRHIMVVTADEPLAIKQVKISTNAELRSLAPSTNLANFCCVLAETGLIKPMAT